VIELIGYSGAFFLTLCAFPQVIHTYARKDANALSAAFLSCWFIGEILTCIYVVDQGHNQKPLVLNYIFNIAAVGYLLWAKWRYR